VISSLQPLLDWVAQNPLWAGVIVFLVALAESLAIVGLVVPGVVIMFGIGALIATDVLAFWPTMVWAVAGAVVGDGLSFFLGRYYRHRLSRVWPFRRYPEMLQRGVSFFERYGGKSVIFGRFVGPVRAVIPLVAGMMQMPPRNFLVANVLSALAWAPAYLLPGMVFGASLELAAEVAVRLVVLMLLLAALIWFVVWLIRQTFRFLHPHSRKLVRWLLEWSQLHPRAGRIAAALADPGHPEAKGLAILASLLLLSTLVTGLIIGFVIQGGDSFQSNQATLQLFKSLRTPWADHLMVFATSLADVGFSLVLFGGVLGFLLWSGHRNAAMHWIAAAVFAFGVPVLLKYGLRIPRPDNGVEGLGPYAFPSAHMMRATVLYGFLSVLLARTINETWRWLPYSLAGLILLLVGLSRVYLGVHWLPDVVGSLSLGILWVAALGIAYHTHSTRGVAWQGLAFVAFVLLIGGSSWQVLERQHQEVTRYRPQAPIVVMRQDRWWSDGWAALPAYRADIAGNHPHPINLQYAGPPDFLRRHLETQGWQEGTRLGWRNALRLLAPSPSLAELPVLPQVHDGLHENLVLERMLEGQQRLVLRLWAANRALEPDDEPLWVGSVSVQVVDNLFDLISYPRTSDRFRKALALLEGDVRAMPHRLVRRPDGAGQEVLLVREQTTRQ
jgi:undecaprenyl-diphosphatase